MQCHALCKIGSSCTVKYKFQCQVEAKMAGWSLEMLSTEFSEIRYLLYISLEINNIYITSLIYPLQNTDKQGGKLDYKDKNILSLQSSPPC